jgi:beta-glucosidase
MADVIEDLLRRMSPAEKIGQLNHPAIGADTTGAHTGAGAANIEDRIRRGEVGALSAGLPLERLAALQQIAVTESPSRIPLLFTLDVLHGHRTIFPLPLGLACAFDPALVRRTARVAATEAAAAGVALAWAPMLDVSRDARWGRTAESPGEDPLLGAAYGRAMVEGFEEGDLAQADTVMACAKHFAGYGFAEGGRDYNIADISPFRMHNVVLPPFKAAVAAGVGAVMVGFHDLAGVPCTAHRELLRDVLRGLWGFDGLIASDYTAILELVNHGVAADMREAALLAFAAGVDLDLVSEAYLRHLPELLAAGRIAQGDLDAACRRVLRAKQRLGLFAEPFRRLDEQRLSAVTLTAGHRRLAREAAAKACVLLKNSGVLPLDRTGRAIAVIGPLADSRANMQGTWAVSAHPGDSVTLLEGIKAAAGSGRPILHAQGTNIVDDPNIAARLNVFGATFAINARAPQELIAEAVAVAQRAEVVVACVGEAKEHSGESSTRNYLALPGSQRRLLMALHRTGRPLVVVTMSGRPLALEWEEGHADAILHAWFGGTETGNAVADVLFGVVNPSGKLAMSFPRNAGQCPIYYAEAPTGRPIGKIGIDVPGDAEVDATGRHVFRKFTTACRLEGAHTPLFPFGHGLGYSAFAYGPIALDKTVLSGAAGAVTATVAVRNAGAVPGEEIVQLYVGDPVARRSRPVRELKAFQKIALAPGETQTVAFRITAADLGYVRADRLAAPEPVCEPGAFRIEIGTSSARLQSATIEWQAGE